MKPPVVPGGFSFGPASARRSDEHGGDDEHLGGKGEKPHRRALDDTHGCGSFFVAREPFRPRNARLGHGRAISTAKIDNSSARIALVRTNPPASRKWRRRCTGSRGDAGMRRPGGIEPDDEEGAQLKAAGSAAARSRAASGMFLSLHAGEGEARDPSASPRLP